MKGSIHNGSRYLLNKLKIGIFGNTNNSPFMLAKAFRMLGCEVRLVVNRPELLHRPESKCDEYINGYPDWIADFSALTSSYVVTESPLLSEVMRFFGSGLDAVVLNDVGLTLNDGRFNCPVLALLTGSDLLYHASYASLDERISGWPSECHSNLAGRKVVERIRASIAAQREGIRRATAVQFMPPGVVPEGDEVLDSLGIAPHDPRRFFLQIADIGDLKSIPPVARRKMRIFNGARIIWKRPLPPGFSDLDHKGTDVLLRGFADYLVKGGEGQLRLVNKGYDVERTKELISELKLTNEVIWLDELTHSEFYKEIASADVVCDHFGTSLPGMVSVDAMTIGRVVLSNFRLHQLGIYYPEPRPFLHATSQEQVCEGLWRMYLNPDERISRGQQAAAYMQKYYSPEVNARLCLEHLGLNLS